MTKAAQIRRWIQVLKPTVAWARAHAVLIVSAVLGVAAALWLLEHDARRKREFELEQLRRTTTAEVSALRRRAASAMEAFRANAQVIRQVEARRAALEREAAALRQKLSSLREEERFRVQSAGTPGHAEMSERVTSRLDPADLGNRGSGVGSRESGVGSRDSGLGEETGNPKSEIGNSKIENGNWKLETGAASVVSGQLSMAAGRQPSTANDSRFRIPHSKAPDGPRSAEDLRSQIQRFRDSAMGAANQQSSIAHRQFPFPTPALASCREQLAVRDELIANCEERVGASQAVIDALNRSVADLQENIRAEDAIAARLAAQQRAELRAARGSRLRRFGRVMQYVGVGVVIGMVAAR